MNNKENNILDKKIILGIIAVLLVFATSVGILAYKNEKNPPEEEPKYTEDQLAFKKAYEDLNGQIRDKDGKTIRTLNIDSNNPVDILTEEETIDILENGTGIIYMGFTDCPWCRTMVPVLLNTLKNTGIEKLYYLDIKDIRSTYVLNNKNKAVKEKDGTTGYYKILELLDKELDNYTLTTSKGKTVKTGEKRLLAPTVVFVKEGKVVGTHVGTVDTQKDPYEDLTEEQTTELVDIYTKLINKVYEINCTEAC